MVRLANLGKVLLACAAACVFASVQVQAQGSGLLGKQPIRIVVPYPAGTFPDIVGRVVADAASKNLGQTIIFDNKPSAGGVIAAETVARAAPDGYTLLLGDVQIWAIDALIYKTLSFQPVNDFAPISIVASTPLILAIGPGLPTSDKWPEVLAHLKANPGKYTYGSAGIGSILHFGMEIIKAKTDIDIRHIPYRGAPQFVPALGGGEIALVLISPSGVAAAQNAGAKLVAVTDSKRVPNYPDVPTFAELGVSGLEVIGSLGFLAPKNTPPAIINQYAAAFQAAAKDPQVLKRLGELGTEAVVTTPEQFAAWIQSDIVKFTEANKTAKVDPQ